MEISSSGQTKRIFINFMSPIYQRCNDIVMGKVAPIEGDRSNKPEEEENLRK